MEKKDKALQIFELFTSMKKVFGYKKDFHRENSHKDLESSVLLFIKFNNEVTQSNIVEKMKVPKQTINNIISNLHKKNYIESKANNIDKRQKILVLTKNGKEYAEELLKPIIEFNEKLFDEIGKEEVALLIENNKKLAKTIKKIIEEESWKV